MSVEKVTTESWGSRLGSSFKGIITGGVLFLAGIPLLFWNEGRAVKNAKALEEGESVCISVPSIDTMDMQNEGKLIHATGNAVTQAVLTDDMFPGISKNAMKLARTVEYYQWVENESTREEKQLGGSVKKTTTYTYEKDWVSDPVDSSSFQEAGHDNVVHLTGVENKRQSAEKVTFGAFTLTSGQIGRISGSKPVELKDVPMPEELKGRTAISGNTVYIGAAASPAVTPLPNGMEPGIATQLPATMYVTVDSYPGQQLLVLDDPTCGTLIQGPTGDMYPMVADEAADAAYMMVNNTTRNVTRYGELTTPAPTVNMQLPGLINVEHLGVLPVVCFGDKVYVRTADNKMLLIKPWQDHYVVSYNGVMRRAYISLAPTMATTSTVNPGAPQVGDVRISWSYVPETMPISIVACQNAGTFSPYVAENGYTVDLMQMGIKSKELMFQNAKDNNSMWTWVWRIVGWLMMYIGLKMILAPISVMADVLPILGNIVEFGIGIIAFFVSAVVALVIIAIAWIFYRPILGILILAAAIGLVVLLIKKKKKTAQPAEPAPQE
ncbi:MAG: TMEM43 family protein [Akkermansia sp.]|nr:TMEM43 family protein [Akkermansia sp.]